MIHKCNDCDYKTPYKANYKRHVKKKHNIYKAPTNTHLQPEVVHSSTEIPQHVPGYQVPMKGYTTQQFDPRSIPQIQYNEFNHQEYGPQHLTGYQGLQGSGVLHTTQQYDPRAKPQIQNNELKHEGNGPQTSVSYSVNPVTNEDLDTETVSEADTEDQEEYDIYEILNDIHLAFDHLKDLREQYRKALPQLKQLDEEEMDKFLYKYAELKIDITNKM